MRVTTVLLYACVLCGCCGCSTDGPDSSRAIDAAADRGRQDASVIADNNASLMERERAILDIKYKEAHLRAMGYDKAADAYIDAAAEIIPDSIKLP